MYKNRPISAFCIGLLIVFGASPAVADAVTDARALSVHLASLTSQIEGIQRSIVASESMLAVAERRLSRFERLYSANNSVSLKQLEHARSEYLRVLERDNQLRKRLMQRQLAQLQVIDQILAVQETPETLQTAGL